MRHALQQRLQLPIRIGGKSLAQQPSQALYEYEIYQIRLLHSGHKPNLLHKRIPLANSTLEKLAGKMAIPPCPGVLRCP